jgi:hypothetical protein
MALIDEIQADIEAATTVVDSATAFITGVPTLIQAAVQAAIANGATAAQLQPVADVANVLEARAAALSAAIVANTPSAPPA